MNRTLNGGLALVTGAGGGIGGAITTALAGEGMRVWLCGRRRESLEVLAARIEPDRLAGLLAADVTRPADRERIAEVVGARLDVLVHAAGQFQPGSPAEVPAAEMVSLFEVNAIAPLDLTRQLLPALRAARGQVVVLNSTAALRTTGPWSVYAATKAALRTLTEGLRDAVNREGIRVLSVLPGRTASPMQARVHEWEGRPYRPDRLMQPADVAAMVIAALKLPDTAELTELVVRPRQPG